MIVWAVVRTTHENGKVLNFDEFIDVGVTEKDADLIIENAKANEEFDKTMSAIVGSYAYQKRMVILKDFAKKVV